jgi:hypothetical protein
LGQFVVVVVVDLPSKTALRQSESGPYYYFVVVVDLPSETAARPLLGLIR